jgi:hypothetical protein
MTVPDAGRAAGIDTELRAWLDAGTAAGVATDAGGVAYTAAVAAIGVEGRGGVVMLTAADAGLGADTRGATWAAVVVAIGADAGVLARCAVVAVDGTDAGIVTRVAVAALVGVDAFDTGLAACDALVIGVVCAGTDGVALIGGFCAGAGGRETKVCDDGETLSAARETGEKSKIASAKASEVRNSLRTLSVIASIMPATCLPHVYFGKGWRLGQLPIAFWS